MSKSFLKTAVILLTVVLIGMLCLSGCGEKNADAKNNGSSQHAHTFQPSTCENPQTCPCGATRGNAVGHSWIDATCITPKTCLACGKTEGEGLGHKFIEGLCEVCGEIDLDEIVDSPKVWISKDGLYHGNRSCSNSPDDPNQESTLAKARRAGIHPCPRCYTAN